MENFLPIWLFKCKRFQSPKKPKRFSKPNSNVLCLFVTGSDQILSFFFLFMFNPPFVTDDDCISVSLIFNYCRPGKRIIYHCG